MSMNPKQIAKSKKRLLWHFPTIELQKMEDRKSKRRTDFMRASHKAYLKRKSAGLLPPETKGRPRT